MSPVNLVWSGKNTHCQMVGMNLVFQKLAGLLMDLSSMNPKENYEKQFDGLKKNLD